MEDALFNRMPTLADWEDEDLAQLAVTELHLAPEDWQVNRKFWEWAMIIRALREYGYLTGTCNALGLGCGKERLMFALANRMRTTVATDLYGQTAFADREVDEQFLRNPESYCDFEFDPRGLLVSPMDATQISYADESFDVLFSCSSLEHFGPTDTINRAQKEAYRILRPGGVYVLAVDYLFRMTDEFKSLPRDERKPISDFFSDADIRETVVGSAPFKLEESLDLADSVSDLFNVVDMETWEPESGSFVPHLYCGYRGNYLTSLLIVFFK
ncbi:MAG: class I SAM-dependent methyltransferase [Actinomycetota bacterium]|jgi:SAM-dependent methyltransferase|nr:class I SAM-dependent methyltransferase [Actinomycetota bacterium]